MNCPTCKESPCLCPVAVELEACPMCDGAGELAPKGLRPHFSGAVRYRCTACGWLYVAGRRVCDDCEEVGEVHPQERLVTARLYELRSKIAWRKVYLCAKCALRESTNPTPSPPFREVLHD